MKTAQSRCGFTFFPNSLYYEKVDTHTFVSVYFRFTGTLNHNPGRFVGAQIDTEKDLCNQISVFRLFLALSDENIDIRHDQMLQGRE